MPTSNMPTSASQALAPPTRSCRSFIFRARWHLEGEGSRREKWICWETAAAAAPISAAAKPSGDLLIRISNQAFDQARRNRERVARRLTCNIGWV